MQERGVDLTLGHTEQLAMQVRVDELMRRDVTLLPGTASRSDALAALRAGTPAYVVDADDETCLGALSYDAVLEPGSEQLTAAELAVPTPSLRCGDNLVSAVARCGSASSIAFPVLSDEDGKVAGSVTIKRIMNAYQGILDRVAREERSFGD